MSAPDTPRQDARVRYERALRLALPTGDSAELDALFAELEGLLDNERLYTAEHLGYAQVVGDENQRLQEHVGALTQALTEACEWLDDDLAHAPDTVTSMADRELVASWRAALAPGTGADQKDGDTR